MEVTLVVSKDTLWTRIELAADSPRLLHVIDVEIRSAAELDSEEREMMLGRVWLHSDDIRRADAATLAGTYRRPGHSDTFGCPTGRSSLWRFC